MPRFSLRRREPEKFPESLWLALVWILPPTPHAHPSRYIFAKTNGEGARYFSLYSIPSRGRLAVLFTTTGAPDEQQGAQFDLGAGVDITDGEPHSILLTATPTQLTLVVDGADAQVQSIDSAIADCGMVSDTCMLFLGQRLNANGEPTNPFTGTVHAARLYEDQTLPGFPEGMTVEDEPTVAPDTTVATDDTTEVAPTDAAADTTTNAGDGTTAAGEPADTTVELVACSELQYRNVVENGCYDLTACTDSEYIAQPATGTSDRVCAAITEDLVCAAGSIYRLATAYSNNLCLPCPAGQTDHDSDADSGCIDCPAGTFAPEGSSGLCEAHACAAGTTDDDSSASTACITCIAGQYTGAGSVGDCSTHVCAIDSTDDDSNPATACVACPAGTALYVTALLDFYYVRCFELALPACVNHDAMVSSPERALTCYYGGVTMVC